MALDDDDFIAITRNNCGNKGIFNYLNKPTDMTFTIMPCISIHFSQNISINALLVEIMMFRGFCHRVLLQQILIYPNDSLSKNIESEWWWVWFNSFYSTILCRLLDISISRNDVRRIYDIIIYITWYSICADRLTQSWSFLAQNK